MKRAHAPCGRYPFRGAEKGRRSLSGPSRRAQGKPAGFPQVSKHASLLANVCRLTRLPSSRRFAFLSSSSIVPPMVGRYHAGQAYLAAQGRVFVVRYGYGEAGNWQELEDATRQVIVGYKYTPRSGKAKNSSIGRLAVIRRAVEDSTPRRSLIRRGDKWANAFAIYAHFSSSCSIQRWSVCIVIIALCSHLRWSDPRCGSMRWKS